MTGKTAGDSLQRLHHKEEHHTTVQSLTEHVTEWGCYLIVADTK